MQDSQTTTDITSNKGFPNYNNLCVGKYCDNIGIHKMIIIHFNKEALFCTRCKKELEKYGLIVEKHDN